MKSTANSSTPTQHGRSYGSTELVKRCFERGDAFKPFNDDFVRAYPKRPSADLDDIKPVLNRFFAEGAPRYGSPFLVRKEYFTEVMSIFGLAPCDVLVADLPG
jgi:hypothetical protein